jgi:hypothetical protein
LPTTPKGDIGNAWKGSAFYRRLGDTQSKASIERRPSRVGGLVADLLSYG